MRPAYDSPMLKSTSGILLPLTANSIVGQSQRHVLEIRRTLGVVVQVLRLSSARLELGSRRCVSCEVSLNVTLHAHMLRTSVRRSDGRQTQGQGDNGELHLREV
jgi:hypothetical protein